MSKGWIEDSCFTHGASAPYLKEWETLAECSDIDEFRKWALSFQLSSSHFRSVYWRVLLGIFPTDLTLWLSIVCSKRELYESLHDYCIVNPGSGDETSDPNLNNPLSQDEQSSWNQYFEDSELKHIIRMDVTRTFPEVEFFRSVRIQDMMVTVLFCYARKYPQISYIQGMHEILAPLIYVLNYDFQVNKDLTFESQPPRLLCVLMDETYMEHDSFGMFETVMEKLHPWYEDGDPKQNQSQKSKLVSSQPFSKAQEMEPTTKIVKKLNVIHECLLKKHEPQVFAHLNQLEILPQLYGIRWVRLMFGREFNFPDLLLVWDSIFADSSYRFTLIDYLVIALLANVREKLLASDYVESMRHLMQYSGGANVQWIIRLALHYQNPEMYAYPPSNTFPQTRMVDELQNLHRVSKVSSHIITRSTSLPRTQVANSTGAKHRSTSVEKKTLTGINEKRPSQTMDPLSVVSFKVYNDEELEERDIPNGSSKMGSEPIRASVSGFSLLGERIGRSNKETQKGQLEPIVKNQPMNELKYVEKSAPIPTPKMLSVDAALNSTSSEEEVDPSFPQKKIIGSVQRFAAEDVLSIGLECALRLSQHQNNLVNRLAQLNIENDLTLRTAMEGITEVIETLKGIKEKPRKSPTKRKAVDPNRACSLPLEHSTFTHPLMRDEDETADF